MRDDSSNTGDSSSDRSRSDPNPGLVSVTGFAPSRATGPIAVLAPRPLLGLLLRTKARSLRNQIVQAAADAPIRVSVAALLVTLIWIGLFFLFWLIFRQFDEKSPLEATVAIPLIFNFFFAAILVMLAFSNAIIAHGSLFSRKEAEYLLAAPCPPRDVVWLKYIESLALSSWSLILLGLPLMAALAQRAEAPYFYAIFLAFFIAFIPIPGALGLLFAWIAARFLPRRAMRVLAVVGGIAIAVFVIWGMRSLRTADLGAEAWLRSFLSRMSLVESALLPNYWVARGIDNALNDRMPVALGYLAVTAANAMFLSTVVIGVLGRSLGKAYDRASAGASSGRRAPAALTGGFSGGVFFYLRGPLRLIAAKDLRTFFRDPLQWSQLVILFGLVFLYLTNMPTLQFGFIGSGWSLVIPFLNLCAISLILAAFTCRFVFPLVSLECQQIWLTGLLPMRRGRVLYAKFAFAMTVTLFVTCGAMALASVVLDLDLVWTIIHLTAAFSICFGLCGLAVGLGARMPVLNQLSAARIANGLGGTANLLLSLILVTVVLTAIGLATWRSRLVAAGDLPDPRSLLVCAAACLTAITAGLAAIGLGARHFDRLEV